MSVLCPVKFNSHISLLTEFCLYNGVIVKQGQVLRMGCDKTCRCDDAKSGQINCQDRY